MMPAAVAVPRAANASRPARDEASAYVERPTSREARNFRKIVHAIRADLLRRMGRVDEAALAYEAAIARSENAVEQAFLRRRREALNNS